MTRRQIEPYIYLIPALAFSVLMTIVPLIYSINVSMYRWDLAERIPHRFIGAGNFYSIFFEDVNFWSSLTTTLVFLGVAVGIEFFFGLGFALLMSEKTKSSRIITTLAVTPMMMASVVIALIWRMLFHVDFGVANYLLLTSRITSKPLLWVASPNYALFSLIIVDVWQWTPFVFLVFLAGLRALPQGPFEVASLEGASKWQMFKHITIPLLKSTIIVVIVIRIIDVFKVFDTVYILTMGGPGGSTEVLSFYTYLVSFKYLKIGYAAALSYIILLIIIGITTVLINVTRKKERR